MARFLVLGAGLVTAPLVEFLCRRAENEIVIANNILADAQGLATGYANASAEVIDVTDKDALTIRATNFDVVLSMVPPPFHPTVARACIEAGTHMVSASYQSPEMLALGSEAKQAGICIMNEIGLDPGIDHLSAMQIIDEAHAKGEQIEAFVSWCGGIPAPDDNDNPLGYKFSWNPKGAILVLLNQADYLKAGQGVTVAAEDLMDWARPVNIGGLDLECYPNRNSLLYKDIYGIPEVSTLIRGTLRYPGFCQIMQLAKALGLFGMDASLTQANDWYAFIRQLNSATELENHKINANSTAWAALEWLGVFSDERLPEGASPLDKFCVLLLEKLSYLDGEKDMIILQHKFIIKRADGTKIYKSARLKSIGAANGFSAMAATVGYPAAMAAQLIADGVIEQTGLLLPVTKNIYTPLLEMLAQENIEFIEQIWQSDEMVEREFIPELTF
ncbi:MAG: saccharopine dehydrogenase NADP-binding domain-containing protein [Robiginitomaculum sp.]|nr:saccharopine dehydrogenase NADP-binding domain-containing protein [Robiginitomaculum sp.]